MRDRRKASEASTFSLEDDGFGYARVANRGAGRALRDALGRDEGYKAYMSGRPWSFDRGAALDKAISLFWRHGYEGVSISMLTEAVGVAPPSLYAAFGSKADLYRAAVARYSEDDGGGEAIPQEGSAYDAVKAALERGIRVVSQPGRPRGCMISSGMLAAGPDHGDLVDEVRRFRTAFRETLQARIARDVRSGALPSATDPAALARFYVSVMQGISIQALDGASVSDLEKVVAEALRAWPTTPA